MNKIVVTATPNHYLYPKLKALHVFRDYKSDMTLNANELLLDFSLTEKKEKIAFVKTHAKQIISDLTLYDHRELHSRGKFSSVFPSPNHKIEMVAESHDHPLLTNFLVEISLSPHFVKDPGVSFVFPRILVQIINEAFFAQEEKVADAKDIDTAMLYGVNYPRGPVEWGTVAGLHHVKALLNELHQITKDDRYLPSSLLTE